MATEKQDNDYDKRKETSTIAKFSGIAFQMVAIIGIFSFAGYKVDQAANHQVKWVTATLALIGVFISLYVVIKSIKS